jgi:serine-type D-Ala-D-Ala carboxypeptidase
MDVAAVTVDAGDRGALAPVVRLLESGVGQAYPGAVLAVLYRGEVILRHAAGATARSTPHRPTTADAIYDLASLTKVVATTPLILQAAAEGRLRLHDPLPRHIPESPHDGVTLRHLLMHTSGLPAWIPFYVDARGYETIVRRAATAPLSSAPGAQVVYSDLGFMLLGEVARRAFGAPLDRLARDRIFDPLDMNATGYRPDLGSIDRIAPTEEGAVIEQEMAGEAGRRHPWRTSLIWGEVHDTNAFVMGGISGHAGLFGPADDLLGYTRMWLAGGRGPRGTILSTDMVYAAVARHAASPRGLGWALSGPHGWWGDALSEHAYGHTGFTGTALAVDPERDLAIVLLSNAVNLGRDRTGIIALRPQIAAAIVRTL